MIEILDPTKIHPSPLIKKMSDGWHYCLDYQWLIAQLLDFVPPGGDTILDVGSYFSQLSVLVEREGYRVETMDRSPDGLYYHHGEFLEYDFSDYGPYDVILWASSIEHQETKEAIRDCYLKSMEILKPGGVFMATFPIVNGPTEWYPQAHQWNLSKQDAMRLFDEDTIRGNFQSIWEAYRTNRYDLRTKYVARFGKWDYSTPVYITAGIVKVK